MSGPSCTWKGCTSEAAVKVVEDGSVNLCDAHVRMHVSALSDALSGKEGGVKRMVGLWVLAQGGADAAAARMTRRFEGSVVDDES